MKPLINIIFILATCTFSLAWAANDKTECLTFVQEKVDVYKNLLSLREDQIPKVQTAICTAYEKRINELDKSKKTDKTAVLTSMLELSEDVDVSMQEILDKNQLAQYQVYKQLAAAELTNKIKNVDQLNLNELLNRSK